MFFGKFLNIKFCSLVKIDPILGAFTNEVMTIPWDQLVSAVLKKMTACTEIIFPDGRVKVLSGKLAQITMQVAKRSGNKKVLLFDYINL